jgi:hypothetical protein
MSIVVAVGDDARDVDAEIGKIYDWRHARALLAVQLALAPAAVAALAIVAKGAAAGVSIGAAVIVAVSLVFGLWRFGCVNQVDSEYALALTLGRALVPFHFDLTEAFRGEGEQAAVPAVDLPTQRPIGSILYDEVGRETVGAYASNANVRRRVNDVFRAARVASEASKAAPSP